MSGGKAIGRQTPKQRRTEEYKQRVRARILNQVAQERIEEHNFLQLLKRGIIRSETSENTTQKS